MHNIDSKSQKKEHCCGSGKHNGNRLSEADNKTEDKSHSNCKCQSKRENSDK